MLLAQPVSPKPVLWVNDLKPEWEWEHGECRLCGGEKTHCGEDRWRCVVCEDIKPQRRLTDVFGNPLSDAFSLVGPDQSPMPRPLGDDEKWQKWKAIKPKVKYKFKVPRNKDYKRIDHAALAMAYDKEQKVARGAATARLEQLRRKFGLAGEFARC